MQLASITHRRPNPPPPRRLARARGAIVGTDSGGRCVAIPTNCRENHNSSVRRSTRSGTISKDPIGFDAGDPNLYRYVGNSPTNATDPSGTVMRTLIKPTAGKLPGQFKQQFRFSIENDEHDCERFAVIQRVKVTVKVTYEDSQGPKRVWIGKTSYFESFGIYPDGTKEIPPLDTWEFSGVPAQEGRTIKKVFISMAGQTRAFDADDEMMDVIKNKMIENTFDLTSGSSDMSISWTSGSLPASSDFRWWDDQNFLREDETKASSKEWMMNYVWTSKRGGSFSRNEYIRAR